MKTTLISLTICLLCFCCKEETANHKILYVELKQSEVPFSDFFSKIEVIPLETNDISLIKKIKKAVYVNNHYYILDQDQYYLFIFDSIGRYVNRIAAVGQGPGEYTDIYDFYINEKKKRIEMLSPVRQIYYYDYNCNFIEDVKFSNEIPYIYKMEYIDTNYLILRSISIITNGQSVINVMSPETDKRINGYGYDNDYDSECGIFSYNKNVFFYHLVGNKVYQVKPDSFNVSYEWKYSKKIIDSAKYRKLVNYCISTNTDIFEKFENGEVEYFYMKQAQTDRYYYAQLFHKYKTIEHVFYDKKTEKSYYFKKTEPEITFKQAQSFVFGNELITPIECSEKEQYLKSSFFDEENRKKLQKFKEEDNPVLIKYTFKQ